MAISHVDDGHLHAYLDGALDAYPPGEAARIRRHLEECAACAARLEEARRIRTRAGELLAAAAPDAGEGPPLEELRRRAAATAPRATGHRISRFGWAASVVLALGTGWLLRGGLAPESASVLPPPPPSVAADAGGERVEVVATPPARDDDVTVMSPARGAADAAADIARPAAPVVPTSPARVAAGPPRSSSSTGADLDAPSRGSDVAQRTAGGASAPALTAALTPPGAPVFSPSALPPVDVPALSVTTPRVGGATVDDEVERRRGAARDALVLTSEERRSAETERRASLAERARRAAARAMSGGPGSMVVPGLELVSVDFVEIAGRDEGAVRVLQLLASGDTVEILHLPPGVSPDSAPGEDGDRTRLEVEGSEGWVVLRARASDEELAALLERLLAA